MSTDAVGREYLKETNMMFIGGLMVAIGVEHSNLHRRIALKVSQSLHPPFELNLSEIVSDLGSDSRAVWGGSLSVLPFASSQCSDPYVAVDRFCQSVAYE